MNKMLPQIKVYDIDYDFIIKNYLDKELWNKKWTLFVYKHNVFTLNLNSINVKTNSIDFDIHYNKYDEECSWNYEIITYNINNTSIKILKQQINGAMFKLMCGYEDTLIRKTDGYKSLCEAESQEKDVLKDIASKFLDENGVTNDEIREVYIDNYVSNNKKTDIYKSYYMEGMKYRILTELMLVFVKITNDKTREDKILNNNGDLSVITDELDELLKNLDDEDYIEDLKYELEAI